MKTRNIFLMIALLLLVGCGTTSGYIEAAARLHCATSLTARTATDIGKTVVVAPEINQARRMLAADGIELTVKFDINCPDER